MTKEQCIDRLTDAIDKEGSQKAFARKHGLSESYLSDVLNGRRDPGQSILAVLGLRIQIEYVKA